MVFKLKRPPTEWKQIFVGYASDNGLITIIYRELKKLNSQKLNPIKTWETEVNRNFSKEEVQMAKKHMEKCLPSLTIKEMQIKTTLQFHLIPIRIAVLKHNKCWRGCAEKGTLIHCW
jgi:hypothetical protein